MLKINTEVLFSEREKKLLDNVQKYFVGNQSFNKLLC